MIKSLNKIKLLLFLIFLSLLISGCDIHRVQVKLSDIEYQNTAQGFIIKNHNYTDILINNELQARQAPSAIISNSTQMITNVNTGLQMLTNVTNNTINIKVIT
jgi:membrane-associated PAP2 superfamily phosphatase